MDKLEIPEFARKPIRVKPSKRSFIVKPFSRKLPTHKLFRKPTPSITPLTHPVFIDKFPSTQTFKKLNRKHHDERKKITSHKFKSKLIYGQPKVNVQLKIDNEPKVNKQDLAFNDRILIESALNNNIKSVTYYNTFGRNVFINDPNSHLGFKVKFDQHAFTSYFIHKSVEHFINILKAKTEEFGTLNFQLELL